MFILLYFQVSHFSKYGLVDDDDEDEALSEQEKKRLKTAQLHQQAVQVGIYFMQTSLMQTVGLIFYEDRQAHLLCRHVGRSFLQTGRYIHCAERQVESDQTIGQSWTVFFSRTWVQIGRQILGSKVQISDKSKYEYKQVEGTDVNRYI